MNNLIVRCIFALILTSVSSVTFSEDIELYVSDVVREAGKSTKVLIIFDNSGSMGTRHIVAEDYSSSKYYTPVGSAHAYNDDATYFNKGGSDNSTTIPSSPSDSRRFLSTINGCEASKILLASHGFYTGRIREYTYKGNNGSWQEVPENNGLNIEVLDCEDDAYIEDSNGGVVNTGSTVNADAADPGYPIDNQGTKKSPQYYDNTLPKTSSNVDWSSGSYVTLYTANYLRWFYGQSVDTITETRMDTAQKSMTSVINTTPSVDFGLEIFNYNKGDGSNDGNGGRIALGVKEMTVANRAALLDLINNQISPETWTPLCESVYEASRYYSGGAVEFGDDDIDVGSGQGKYEKNTPPADPSIISKSKYITPFSDCASSLAHIILITDGEPTYDNGANSKIEALEAMVQKEDADGFPVYDSNGAPVYYAKKFDGTKYIADGSNSYLPALAGWMATYDVNDDLDGEQLVSTHTIGFSSGAAGAEGLLKETANRGNGSYFAAQSGLQLTQALIQILNKLPQSNDSLTSASVAANNFDRTQTLDYVYYSMFQPQTGARWQGNIKKYKAGDELIDANGNPAVCEVSGTRAFCQTSQSFWSSGVDGDNVGKGGVAEWFSNKLPSDRTLYMDSGNASLVDYKRSNLETAFTDAAGLATELGVAGLVDDNGDSIESETIDDLIAWSTGQDVDDENNDDSTTDMRQDVFGDPLHSKPLVVNYGDSIRIIVGTNSGALHMFEDEGSSVKENWAFMPKEFIRNIKNLRENYSTANKVYGIDGEITAYRDDKNGNGIIESGDKVWIFFGLRRGGSSYYALDISDPDSKPSLMWHIDSSTPGFSTLGQSWSTPKIGYSKLAASGSTASPVLFIGGGYDTNKDSSGVGTSDGKGNAVYMLNAESGSLLWSLAPSGGTTTFTGTDSIAAPIGLLASSGTGFTDRLYVSDTGGNVWRVDMPGTDTSLFTVFRLASLGHETDHAQDERFFYEPTIVRTLISETIETTATDSLGQTSTMTVHQEVPYDAVLVGSGDRANPLNKDTQNRLYMIKDSNIVTQSFTASSVPAIPAAFTLADLYDYTDNPFAETMTSQEEEKLQIDVSEMSGWYIDLTEEGEKSTAEAEVINGIAYFTTYSPAASTALVSCAPPEGAGWIYAVDLALGTRKHNVTTDTRSDDNRIIKVNNEWLGPPTLIVLPEDDGDDDTADQGSGDLVVGDKIVPVGFTINTSRTYLYGKEEN